MYVCSRNPRRGTRSGNPDGLPWVVRRARTYCGWRTTGQESLPPPRRFYSCRGGSGRLLARLPLVSGVWLNIVFQICCAHRSNGGGHPSSKIGVPAQRESTSPPPHHHPHQVYQPRSTEGLTPHHYHHPHTHNQNWAGIPTLKSNTSMCRSGHTRPL